jgi:hypothetical protein
LAVPAESAVPGGFTDTAEPAAPVLPPFGAQGRRKDNDTNKHEEKTMKRKQGVFFGAAVLLLTALFIVAGCDTGGTDPVPVTGVSLNGAVPELYMKTTAALTATVVPANATNKNVTWSSSDESVATVTQEGLVTPAAAATADQQATITVTTADGGKTDACTVTVKAPINIGNQAELEAIDDSPANMNKSYTLTADIAGPVTAPIGLKSGDTPIPFTGDFDGGGHTVTLNITSGLDVSLDTPQGSFSGILAGLFAAVGDLPGNPGARGKVYDLKVAGAIDVSGAAAVVAGGVAGVTMPGAEIRNVASSVDVSATGGGGVNAGGVAGVSQGTVSDVYAIGAVSATTSAGTASAYAGGIAGAAAQGSTVSYAYATGSITVTGTGTGPGQNDHSVTLGAGGIAGAATSAPVSYTVALNSAVSVNNNTTYNRCSFRITSTSGGTVITNGGNYGKSDLSPAGGSYSPDPGADQQDGASVVVTGGPPSAYTAPTQDWWTDTAWTGADWSNDWKWDGTAGLPKLSWE